MHFDVTLSDIFYAGIAPIGCQVHVLGEHFFLLFLPPAGWWCWLGCPAIVVAACRCCCCCYLDQFRWRDISLIKNFVVRDAIALRLRFPLCCSAGSSSGCAHFRSFHSFLASSSMHHPQFLRSVMMMVVVVVVLMMKQRRAEISFKDMQTSFNCSSRPYTT